MHGKWQNFEFSSFFLCRINSLGVVSSSEHFIHKRAECVLSGFIISGLDYVTIWILKSQDEASGHYKN